MQIFFVAYWFCQIRLFQKILPQILSMCQILGLDPDQDQHYGMFVILFSFKGFKSLLG